MLEEAAPGPAGTITVNGGATVGDPSEPGSYFSLVGGGQLLSGSEDVQFGAIGPVAFTKPADCLAEMEFQNFGVNINGDNSQIYLESNYEIGTASGATCVDQPPVSSSRITFATLHLGSIKESYSEANKEFTWSNVPATLTAAGSAAWGGLYPAGQALDPVTLSIFY